MSSHYPRADEIREALLSRADALARLTGLSRSVISKKALNDTSFLHKVAAGGNFTVRSYERLMAWIDRRDKSYEPRDGFVKRQKRENHESTVKNGGAKCRRKRG